MKHNTVTSVIVDTGFFLALATARDKFHTKAQSIAIKYKNVDWITTWPVVTELSHMLSQQSFVELFKDQRKGLFEIFSIQKNDFPRMIELLEKYKDHQIDMADISLILLAENLNHGNILSCDQKDFSFLKWKNRYSFHNLFFE